MTYNQILKFDTVIVDESMGQTYKFARSYGVEDGLPGIDVVGTNLLNAASKYWETIKSPLLAVMHSQQFVSQIVANVWEAVDNTPSNASPIIFTPEESTVGLSSFIAGNAGGNSVFMNFRLGLKYGGIEEHATILGFGDPVKKAASWRLPCSSTMFDGHGYCTSPTARALAVDLCVAWQTVFDVDEVPLLTLPGFAAHPVATSYVYADEALGGDPDSSNNQKLRAFWEGQGVSFSSLVRNKRTARPEAYYGA